MFYFKNEHTGCMNLFQTDIDQLDHEETVDVHEFNVLKNKHSPSFRKIIEEFLITDEPTAPQQHVVIILLN